MAVGVACMRKSVLTLVVLALMVSGAAGLSYETKVSKIEEFHTLFNINRGW